MLSGERFLVAGPTGEVTLFLKLPCGFRPSVTDPVTNSYVLAEKLAGFRINGGYNGNCSTYAFLDGVS